VLGADSMFPIGFYILSCWCASLFFFPPSDPAPSASLYAISRPPPTPLAGFAALSFSSVHSLTCCFLPDVIPPYYRTLWTVLFIVFVRAIFLSRFFKEVTALLPNSFQFFDLLYPAFSYPISFLRSGILFAFGFRFPPPQSLPKQLVLFQSDLDASVPSPRFCPLALPVLT